MRGSGAERAGDGASPAGSARRALSPSAPGTCLLLAGVLPGARPSHVWARTSTRPAGTETRSRYGSLARATECPPGLRTAL